MFDRFTDRARKVMAFSRKEAQRLNHDFIGTEHILLGLTEERTGVAADVLKNLGVNFARTRTGVEKTVQPGAFIVTTGQLPFTPGAKKVLELSMEEANDLGHDYIGTEHLLLGLLRETDGVAARVLQDLGLTPEAVRKEVLNILEQDPSGPVGDPRQLLQEVIQECDRIARLVKALKSKIERIREVARERLDRPEDTHSA